MEVQTTQALLPIQVKGEVLTISSIDFAGGLGIQHKNLLETIRTHRSSIEKSFGKVTFETEPSRSGGGGQSRTIVHLTEEQALFVGSLSRNSERVIEFKAILVKSFVEARRQLTVQTGQVAPSPDMANILLAQGRAIDIQQQQIRQLTQQVNQIMSVMDPIQKSEIASSQIRPNDSPVREAIINIINRYCETRGADVEETWFYAFKALHVQNGVDARKLYRSEGQTHLDALERHGQLDKLLAVVSLNLA